MWRTIKAVAAACLLWTAAALNVNAGQTPPVLPHGTQTPPALPHRAQAPPALPLEAQTPPGLLLEAQPLVYEREGAVQGCGVRLTGGQLNGPGASSWFDVSFNVFRRGVALAQSIAYEIRRSEYEGDSLPALVPVQSTWLTASEGTVRRGENAEQRESLVYAIMMDDALSLFEALAQGQPLQLGIKRWGQRTDSVYSGTPGLSSESRNRIGECLASLALHPDALR